MAYSPIDYHILINQFPRGVNSCDFVTYILPYSVENSDLLTVYRSLSDNSNVIFQTDDKLQLDFILSVSRSPGGFALNINLKNDEFDFPAINFFCSYDHYIKINLYGLFFRFCVLYHCDYLDIFFRVLSLFRLPFDLETVKLSRVDLAIDMFDCTMDNWLDFLQPGGYKDNSVIKSRSFIPRVKKGVLETLEIGSKKNKYAYVVVYDKILDISRKGKHNFYKDYPNVVTRFEFRVGSRFIGSEIFVDNVIEKMYSFLQLAPYSGPYFSQLGYNPDIIIDGKNYKKSTLKRLEKLLKNGFYLKEDIYGLQCKYPGHI